MGDEPFRPPCIARIQELVERGKTLVVVSHDLDLVQDICERGIVMEKGRVVFDGPAATSSPSSAAATAERQSATVAGFSADTSSPIARSTRSRTLRRRLGAETPGLRGVSALTGVGRLRSGVDHAEAAWFARRLGIRTGDQRERRRVKAA